MQGSTGAGAAASQAAQTAARAMLACRLGGHRGQPWAAGSAAPEQSLERLSGLCGWQAQHIKQQRTTSATGAGAACSYSPAVCIIQGWYAADARRQPERKLHQSGMRRAAPLRLLRSFLWGPLCVYAAA